MRRGRTITVDLRGLPREDLLVIADRACCVLCQYASMLTTDEGDRDETEAEFGLDASEIVEMAHDNFIIRSRDVISRIVKDYPRAGRKADDTEAARGGDTDGG